MANVQDVYGEAGTAWLKKLPTLLNQLGEKRQFRFLQVMPELTYHFASLVEIMATQEIAVLKMAPTHQNIAAEAKWYSCFEQGIPKIYWFDEEYYALLMEQLVPGKSLKTMVSVDDDEATRIICRTLRDLQSHQIKQVPFKHLSELSQSFSVLKGRLDNKMLTKAIFWFNELTSDRTQDVLLHGDLHHDNILSSGVTWKAIDPHGYLGDPAFEVGPMIYNPKDCFPHHRTISQIIDRRFNILTEELSFDPKRMKAWAFCMTVLSMAWTVEDHGYVSDFELAIAGVIGSEV